MIARQVWQVANVLDASLTEMTLNDLGNPQARDNMQTAIITPLRNLHGDLLQRLRAAVDALAAPSAITEDKRSAAIDLADQSVETMQAILAQMSLWESFIDVVNQLKQIIDRQDHVLEVDRGNRERADRGVVRSLMKWRLSARQAGADDRTFIDSILPLRYKRDDDPHPRGGEPL